MGIVDPVTKDLSDEELVRRSASGDEKAISELYDRYSRPVYATGLRLLGDTSLAEELVQDAFTRVWTSAQTFDSSRASFATWLYRITCNRGVDLDRRRRARPSLAGASAPGPYVPRHDRPQGETVLGSKGLVVHLVGQKYLRSHALLHGDRGPVVRTPTFLDLVQPGEGHVPGPFLDPHR